MTYRDYGESPLTRDQKAQLNEATSTGLIDGGIISIGSDTTTFDITAGAGRVVDTTDPTDIIVTRVEWEAQSAIPVTNIATQVASFISIDVDGNIIQRAAFPKEEIIREEIVIGSVIHPNLTAVTGVTQLTDTRPFQIGPTISDMSEALGAIKISGLEVSGDPAGNLSIYRSSGKTFFAGFQRDPNNPNTLESPAATAPSLIELWQDGAGGFYTDTSTTIRAGVYDDGAAPSTGPNGVLTNNSWTTHRICFSPDLGTHCVEYGQYTYNSLSAAMEGLRVESFNRSPALVEVPILCALFMRGGAIDLTDPADAAFQQTDKFGLF